MKIDFSICQLPSKASFSILDKILFQIEELALKSLKNCRHYGDDKIYGYFLLTK